MLQYNLFAHMSLYPGDNQPTTGLQGAGDTKNRRTNNGSNNLEHENLGSSERGG